MELRTVKIELNNLSDEQIHLLKETAKQCNTIFEYFVKKSKENKSCSYVILHKKGYYDEAKKLCPNLPTGLIQTTAKTALITCKSWNSNNPKKRWKFDISRKANTIDLNVLTLNRRGNLTTISTIGKRIKTIHDVPKWFVEKYSCDEKKPPKLQAGKVKILSNNKVILYLIYDVKISKPIEYGKIIGIDRGLYNLFTTSDGEKISSKEFIAVKRRYQYLRSQLQQKGTKSAKRKLKRLSGKEKRFMLDINHKITKYLASRNNVSIYVLEDLSGIRKQNRGKKLNSWLSNWSFYEFERLLEYKCRRNGIKVVKVDPHFTSQKCSLCGRIDSESRNKNKYVCRHCGFVEHADINAAVNIMNTYARSLQSGQADFNQPNVG